MPTVMLSRYVAERDSSQSRCKREDFQIRLLSVKQSSVGGCHVLAAWKIAKASDTMYHSRQ
jgi:hypothetical protein